MKKGKALEQLVSAIQDHLKNCPNTDIQTNVTFQNLSGNKIVEDNNNSEHYDSEGNLYYCSTNSEIDPIVYMNGILQMYMPNMVMPIQENLSKTQKSSGDLPITITPPEKMYILDINGNKHIIKELRISVRVYLNTELQNVVGQNVCVDPLKQASTIKITEYPQKEDASLFLIESKDSPYSAYLKSSDDNVKKHNFIPSINTTLN